MLASVNSLRLWRHQRACASDRRRRTEPRRATTEEPGRRPRACRGLALADLRPEFRSTHRAGGGLLDRLERRDAESVGSLERRRHGRPPLPSSGHVSRLSRRRSTNSRSKLRAFVAGEARAAPAARARHRCRPVFVFTGMGPQWWAMGRELMASEPVFREAAQAQRGVPQPFRVVDPRRDAGGEAVSRCCLRYRPATRTLCCRWVSRLCGAPGGWSRRRSLGHSVGEVSRCLCRRLSSISTSAALVSYHRSHLQQRAAGQGRMLAVGLSAEAVDDLLDSFRDLVSIAAVNSPSSVTLAGDRARPWP